jgi:hypothetical protein
MSFHPEVMPVTQQEMLRRLGPLAAERGFYLAGGTAIAVQIGHRRSLDLDWFTIGEIVEPMRLATELRRSGIPFEVADIQKGTLHGAANSVKLSFLEYRYPELVEPVEWVAYQCRLAGLEDLACMKLSAIGDRGARKDFIDIYALGRERFALGQMLEFYQRKYETGDLGHTLFALTYFDDAEEEDTPEMLWEVEWDEVRHTIEGWVRDYVRKQAPPLTGGEGILR